MKKPKEYRSIIIFFLLIFFCGCASFRAGNLPPISEWPPDKTGAKGKSISLVLSGKVSLNGKESDAHPRMMEMWREQAVKAYQESGLFSEVKTGSANSDLLAEIKIVDQGEANLALAFLTGLTLYVIPSKATDKFMVETTIKDIKGGMLGTFRKTETVTLWQQLFMVFAMPFNFPPSVVKDTLYDLSRATINEAHSQNLF